MLDRLVNEKISVVAVLEDEAITAPHDYKRLKLSGMQWDLAEEMLKVLKPLQVATALCEERSASISAVYPIVAGLLAHMADSDDASAALKHFQRLVSDDLKRRFPS